MQLFSTFNLSFCNLATVLATFPKIGQFFSNFCGLYYKHMTIVNDDSSVVNQLEALLTDDARGVIYDHCKFIIQATGHSVQEYQSLRKLKILDRSSSFSTKSLLIFTFLIKSLYVMKMSHFSNKRKELINKYQLCPASLSALSPGKLQQRD